jgi:signal transduction histidine kinase
VQRLARSRELALARNNLLTSIAGNVQLMLMELQPRDPLAESLTEISKAADSAGELTRQLLAFSRKHLIEPKVLDLNELILRMHKMLVRLIGEDIELKTIPGEHLGAVRIDPGQFEQILVNLAVNARDAMSNGGRLVIETANVELDSEYCQVMWYVKQARSYQDMTFATEIVPRPYPWDAPRRSKRRCGGRRC